MEFKNLEFFSNQEWAEDPDTVTVWVNDQIMANVLGAVAAMEGLSADAMDFNWVGDWLFFDAEGKEFVPDYSVEGCHMKVHSNGHIQFRFPFKHTGDRGWTDSVALPVMP